MVGWHAKQAVQRKRGTALQGCDSAKTGKGAKAGNAPHKPKTQQTETQQPSGRRPAAVQAWRPPPGGRQLRRAAYPMPWVGRGTRCAAVQRSVSMVVDSARQRFSRWPQRALKTLSGMTGERPRSQSSGTPMSHSRRAETRVKSRCMALRQSCSMWLATRAAWVAVRLRRARRGARRATGARGW